MSRYRLKESKLVENYYFCVVSIPFYLQGLFLQKKPRLEAVSELNALA